MKVALVELAKQHGIKFANARSLHAWWAFCSVNVLLLKGLGV